MKDKIKKIFTIIIIIFAVLFGFSWVKSCNAVENIKTYNIIAQNAPKRANEQLEDNKDYIIFDSEIISKVEVEQEEYFSYDNQIIVDLWRITSTDFDLKIYFKKGYAYQKTEFIDDNFITSTLNDEDMAFDIDEYDNMYDYSLMRISHENDNSNIAQVTTISLKEDLIKHNFDYLTNRSIILNNNLSSQFGDNLYNIANDQVGYALGQDGGAYQSSNQSSSLFIRLEPNTTYSIINAQWYNLYTNNVSDAFTRQLTSTSFTTSSIENYLRLTHLNSVTDVMLTKGSSAFPYKKYIDISTDRVRLLTSNNNLNDRTFATYFYASSYKTLIPKYEQIPIISLENNSLGFSIGTGTETTQQKIYDYINNVYYYSYGLVPRTLSFSNQFNHNNLNCFILNQYYEGYADYNTEILMTEYLLNNSQPFTTEQIDTYNIGYQVGKSDGIYQALEWTNLIKVLANSLDNFLNIQILPNITIKILIFIPIMFAILSFIIKAFIR